MRQLPPLTHVPTIRDADVILVMDKGALIEQGTHHDLMTSKGFYYDLYASQFSASIVE
jgi:ATP-binding cassette, subfamily B, multidrug efflux pump